MKAILALALATLTAVQFDASSSSTELEPLGDNLKLLSGNEDCADMPKPIVRICVREAVVWITPDAKIGEHDQLFLDILKDIGFTVKTQNW